MSIYMTKTKLIGSLEVPGDKALSHRSLIFAAFSKGTSRVENLSPAGDCLSTVNCLRQLGLDIAVTHKNGTQAAAIITAAGISKLAASQETLFADNSGTTMRMLAGLLAGRPFSSHLDGDDSLRRRPMARVLEHLKTMGATISYANGPGLAPFTITGGNLEGTEFKLTVASAQVQTALLLAGLQAKGKTTVILPGPARDHTERMFSYTGIPYNKDNEQSISVEKLSGPIKPFTYNVMGDISSAAFFMVAAACSPGSDLMLTNVGINEGT